MSYALPTRERAAEIAARRAKDSEETRSMHADDVHRASVVDAATERMSVEFNEATERWVKAAVRANLDLIEKRARRAFEEFADSYDFEIPANAFLVPKEHVCWGKAHWNCPDPFGFRYGRLKRQQLDAAVAHLESVADGRWTFKIKDSQAFPCIQVSPAEEPSPKQAAEQVSERAAEQAAEQAVE